MKPHFLLRLEIDRWICNLPVSD